MAAISSERRHALCALLPLVVNHAPAFIEGPQIYLPRTLLTYICEQDSYADATRGAFFEFTNSLFDLKSRYSVFDAPDDTVIAQIRTDVNALIESSTTKIMDQIQVESGKYELTVTLSYRQKGKLLPFLRNKTVSSSISFIVEDNVRDYFRITLKQYLEARTANELLNQQNSTAAPTYTPQDIREKTWPAWGELQQIDATNRMVKDLRERNLIEESDPF